jgi:hypothetical protein
VLLIPSTIQISVFTVNYILKEHLEILNRKEGNYLNVVESRTPLRRPGWIVNASIHEKHVLVALAHLSLD